VGTQERRLESASARASAQGSVRDRPGRSMHSCSIRCMQSTSVRIDQATHQELKRLAVELGTTVGETVALAVRRLRQDRLGEDLASSLTNEEVEWLDAELR